ncbi:MAG: hypothetical protein WAW75_00345 [Gallionella sp.]
MSKNGGDIVVSAMTISGVQFADHRGNTEARHGLGNTRAEIRIMARNRKN